MNIQLYQKFEETIHNPSTANTLVEKISHNKEEEEKSLNYILDRVVKAGMSTDIGIKLNACSLLQILARAYEKKINRLDLIKNIEELSEDSKAVKKNEKTALILGRFLLLKALSPLNKDEYKNVSALLKPVEAQPDLIEHLLESMNELYAKIPKETRLSLIKSVKTSNQKDEYLKRALLLKDNTSIAFKQEEIDSIIEILISELPKQSSIPALIVKSLKLSPEKWREFWKHLIDKFGDQEKYNYKGVYIILELLHHRVSENVDESVIESIKVTELWDLWMNELNVMNKKGKEKAFAVQINIGENQKIADDLVRYIHDNEIYLNNLHFKHPLINVYKQIDVEPYLKYLIVEIQKAEDKEEWVSELYSIIHINFDRVGDKTLIKAIHILLRYNIKFPIGEKYVQMVWSILNMKSRTQKSNEVHEFNISILSSIIKNLTKIGLPEEEIGQLKDVYEQSLPELEKLPENLRNPFKNFIVNALLFSVLWNEEIETCLEFPVWLADLVLYIKRLLGEEVPTKKKVKKAKTDDVSTEPLNKPIHILVEYFTSFLTKSPTFLRDSIEKCFQECVQYYVVEDLEKLLAVVFKPDADYIEEEE